MSPQQYFNVAVFDYNAGDVRALLTYRPREVWPPPGTPPRLPLGPLLISTLNGIDICGGICYGFKDGCPGSRKRSALFLENFMGFDLDAASLIYTSARCGIAHQGMAKVGLLLTLQIDDHCGPPQEPLGIDDRGRIILCVNTLAERYLAAVAYLQASPQLLKFVPEVDSKDEALALSVYRSLPRVNYEQWGSSGSLKQEIDLPR